MAATDAILLGRSLPVWSVLPFAFLLLAIALFPLVASSFWTRHYGKVCLAFGFPVAAYFLVRAPHELLRTATEYVSFLVLLGSLFTVSGGILLRGTLRATPGVNCAALGAGAVLANVLGTTGASLLLIRPLLRANAHRRRAAHVVIFFIFIVGNIGGLLSAIGDPPLFLGYLKGVPFLWPLRAMWRLWLFACALVIGVFYIVDRRAHALDGVESGNPGEVLEAPGAVDAARVPMSVDGKLNLFLLAVVIGAVFLPTPWRETSMVAAAGVSIWKTPAKIREENDFTYHPIAEVAILFAGIFATMIPALLLLKTHGGQLGLTSPAGFFWASGGLSSFLDNSPTYLGFFSLAQGLGGERLVAGVSRPILRAISAGSVFMGANTYIGNAPNFMVKAIAEGTGVRMPSFLGYMAWSAVILLPVFALVTLIFF